MNFQLTSKYKPTGDQPQAIRQLTEGIEHGDPAQVLLGVTGSGKTFTVANVIANVNKPTLVLSHNKTLAAQLYEEMKGFFPNNAVDYYVSYYDYYQPEAYLPATDLYIEKDLAINEEIDKLRLAAVSDLLSGRQDVIVVSSVSCIYGMGGPVAMQESIIDIKQGRHPVIERQMPVGEEYVANDLYLDSDKQQIIILTGPNMAGKSALLRQTALITIMAQIGSFVPADSARIGLTDKIFTRVGASDNISMGESTFMVRTFLGTLRRTRARHVYIRRYLHCMGHRGAYP